MHTISLPISVKVSKKDKFYLNLNAYRNAHYHTLNKAKVLFQDLVTDAVHMLPRMKKVELIFTLFMGSQRSADLSNICSVVDKFFCDALVNLGILPDDNFDVISSVDYRFGGIDKENPRVDVTINPLINTEDEIMQITIVQTEIEQAITDFIRSQINVNDNMEINIDLRATRGAEGFQADISIVPAQTKPGRKPASVATQATAAPVKTETKGETPAPRKAAPVADPEPEQVAGVAEPYESEEAQVEEPVEYTETEEATPAVEKKTRSLFGGLTN